MLVIKLFKLSSQAVQQFMPVSRGIQIPTSVSLLKYSILRLRCTLTGKAVTLVKPVLAALLLASMATSSYAITASQAASMVQANPGLLNTPEAQAALAERGLTSGDVLGQISENSAEVSPASTEAGANDVDTSEGLEVESPPLKATSIYSNPLVYKSNADLLSEIKSQQSISQDGVTERFSSVFFKNKNTQDLGSLPVPDYYIVSKGDELSIWIYGSFSTTKNKLIRRAKEGMIGWDQLEPMLMKIEEASKSVGECNDNDKLYPLIRELVPQFNPQANGFDNEHANTADTK